MWNITDKTDSYVHGYYHLSTQICYHMSSAANQQIKYGQP